MTTAVVVVELLDDWQHECPGLRVLSAREYLRDGGKVGKRELVVNLCRRQDYQSPGYYCSLLAEARSQRVIPTVQTSLDLQQQPGLGFCPRGGLDLGAQRWLDALDGDQHTIDVVFGQTCEPALSELAHELFERFRAPLLRLEVRRDPERIWQIHSLGLRPLDQLPTAERLALGPALERWLTRRWREPRSRTRARQTLAILVDPADPMAPSNRRALKRFLAVAEQNGLSAELITRHDRDRLAEFDALFIRTTTRVDHYTYQMACQAEREGLVVIDDPQSIIRCGNKVYQAELLRCHGVPTPTTVILALASGPSDLDKAERLCGYPIVLKVPDGSSSRGVFKVHDRAELEAQTQSMFLQSELVIAQAYTYTEYDWRIGILANIPIFASKYHMAKNHWQVYKHGETRSRYGSSENLDLADVPSVVLDTALAAARPIGDGLYGVDLKQTSAGEILVIEVNDNPNIDSPSEDRSLGDQLYAQILAEFARRIAG